MPTRTKDRQSASGKDGRAKKGGKGGSYTWEGSGSEDAAAEEVAAPSPEDLRQMRRASLFGKAGSATQAGAQSAGAGQQRQPASHPKQQQDTTALGDAAGRRHRSKDERGTHATNKELLPSPISLGTGMRVVCQRKASPSAVSGSLAPAQRRKKNALAFLAADKFREAEERE